MKVLKERTEIAKAINLRKYPVLTFDLSDKDEYGLKGCKVRIDAGTFSDGRTPHTVDAQLRVYKDEKRLAFLSESVCLHSHFCYSDLAKMVEYAQAPLIGPDMDVVIVFHDSVARMAFPPIIVHTSDWVNPFCSQPMRFEDVDCTKYLVAAGVIPASAT